MLTVLSLLPHKSQLEYFSKKLLAYSVLTQEKAFSTKETKEVRIEKNRAFFDDIEFKYQQYDSHNLSIRKRACSS